jgi:prepilin-type N-terminal cleavage/methylation domain-containing protein
MTPLSTNLTAGRPNRGRGLTLVECLLALTILAGAFLAAVSTASVGHQHLRAGDAEFQAVRLARDLLEEIVAKPYLDPAVPDVFGPEAGEVLRTDFDDVNDYHNYSEPIGQLRDLKGNFYPAAQQVASRQVSVVAGTAAVPALAVTAQGATVTVSVTNSKGKTWQFARFVTKPR